MTTNATATANNTIAAVCHRQYRHQKVKRKALMRKGERTLTPPLSPLPLPPLALMMMMTASPSASPR